MVIDRIIAHLVCHTVRPTQVLAKYAIWLWVTALLVPASGWSAPVTAGEVIGTEQDSPPPATADWQAGTLPYFQSFLTVDTAPEYQWFRFHVPAASDKKQALFIARHMRNANIYVNGQLLHQERDTGHDYVGWNTPLLLELQPATLNEPQNEIVIGLQRSVGSSYLNTVQVGDYNEVAALYRSVYLSQLQIPLAAMISSLILGALAFGVWLTRRQHVEYLYYCAACAAWSAVMVFMVSSQPLLLDLQNWILLSYFNIYITGLCFVAFIVKVLDLGSLRWLNLTMLGMTAALLVFTLLPMRSGIALSFPLALFTLGAMVWVGYRTLSLLRKRPQRKVRWVAASLVPMLLMPLLDLFNYASAIINDSGFAGTTLSQFSFPFSLAILFIHIVHQLWHALNESERMNRELVARVQAATTELEANLQERHQLQLQESAQQERQKIYRDLHDDVGAKLTSILHAPDQSRQKQMARAALESLRETIHHANYQQQTLEEFVTAAADEMEVRLQAAGLTFHRPANLSFPTQELTSAESYHLTRAIREITNNILHHARASAVTFSAVFSPSRTFQLDISDNGCGFQADLMQGNGMTSIRQRVSDIGGTVHWHSRSELGCTVAIKLWNLG